MDSTQSGNAATPPSAPADVSTSKLELISPVLPMKCSQCACAAAAAKPSKSPDSDRVKRYLIYVECCNPGMKLLGWERQVYFDRTYLCNMNQQVGCKELIVNHIAISDNDYTYSFQSRVPQDLLCYKNS